MSAESCEQKKAGKLSKKNVWQRALCLTSSNNMSYTVQLQVQQDNKSLIIAWALVKQQTGHTELSQVFDVWQHSYSVSEWPGPKSCGEWS